MSTAFDTNQDAVIVRVHIWGPTADVFADFVLDTGAVETVIGANILTDIGYDLTKISGRVRLTTASGIEFAPRPVVHRFEALGQTMPGYPVLGLTLPPSAKIDGLLGLDFIRGQDLTISYRTGLITLT